MTPELRCLFYLGAPFCLSFSLYPPSFFPHCPSHCCPFSLLFLSLSPRLMVQPTPNPRKREGRGGRETGKRKQSRMKLPGRSRPSWRRRRRRRRRRRGRCCRSNRLHYVARRKIEERLLLVLSPLPSPFRPPPPLQDPASPPLFHFHFSFCPLPPPSTCPPPLHTPFPRIVPSSLEKNAA